MFNKYEKEIENRDMFMHEKLSPNFVGAIGCKKNKYKKACTNNPHLCSDMLIQNHFGVQNSSFVVTNCRWFFTIIIQEYKRI